LDSDAQQKCTKMTDGKNESAINKATTPDWPLNQINVIDFLTKTYGGSFKKRSSN